jgi:hypothetical protein
LYPDVDNPFFDAVDAVNRLLPYHIFQQPRVDLHSIRRVDKNNKKGKGKAIDDDDKIEGPSHFSNHVIYH